MNKRIVYFLLIINVLVMNACTDQSKAIVEKLPGIDIPLTEFNTKFRLQAWSGEPQFYKAGDSLDFAIDNLSNETIYFSSDFGAKIFKKQNSGWEPVLNGMGYPEVENILFTSAVNPTGLVLSVFPDTNELNTSAIYRIVAIGHVENKPNEQIGAYIDVRYEP